MSSRKETPPHISVDGTAFSPDGKLVGATFSYSQGKPADGFKAVRVWDVATGREIASFCEDVVWGLAFLPDGKRVILKPREGKIEIREAHTGKLLAKFEDSSPDADLLGVTPDGKLALTGSWREEEGVRLVDVETRKLVRVLDKRRSGPPAIFTPDGKAAYVQLGAKGKEDFIFGVWQLRSGKLVRYSRQADYELYPLTFSPDGKLALSETPQDRQAPGDDRLVLWDVASGAEVRWLRGPAGQPPPAAPFTYPSVCCAAFSADGKRVVAILRDWRLHCWEVATGTELWASRVHHEMLTACAISPDGRRAITAAGAKLTIADEPSLLIRLWDATDGHFLKALAGAAPLPDKLAPGK
jgi:WD40 repeat protein